MRRLAARLPTPASHARLRRTIQVSRSGIAAHVSPSRSTASSWCARPRWLKNEEVVLPQRRWMVSPTTPLSQDLSSSSPVPPPPPTDPPPITHSPPLDEDGKLDPSVFANLPFRFDTGIALFAKRTPRPFPPPFLSPPSGSFSDPLSTHDRSRDRRRAYVDGHLIQGFTNGDDAVFASDYFICANDGVGAWSTRPRGHAGLWARLILHFWATAVFEDAARQGASYRPDPVGDLQRAYEQTIEATGPPNDWQGTTTVAGAQLHYRRVAKPPTPNDNDNGDGNSNSNSNGNNNANANASSATNPNANGPGNDAVFEPVLYVTNLGDSQVMVIRPSTRTVVYKSVEQWHWFDCPRQLGTNSPDTPRGCAVVDEVALREGDVVLAMSDGVIDNLWAHEIVATVCDALERWTDTGARGVAGGGDGGDAGGAGGGGVVAAPGVGLSGDGESDSVMGFVAEELMEAARTIAVDPFAESPFMEHAIEEGLASGGGKLDDISVVAAICRRNGSG